MFAESLARTIAQITDPAFLRVLARSLALTIAVLWLAVFATGYGVSRLYMAEAGVLSGLAAWAVGFIAVWAASMMFIPLAAIFSGIFLDDVVDAVEARYYPDRRAGKRLGAAAACGLGLKIGLYILLFNILAVPVYVLTIWVPFAPIVIFYGLNAYLIGWGFYELVAIRHLGLTEATRHRKSIRGRIMAAGLMITAMFTLPLLNLLAPILGMAFLVHIFHASPIAAEVNS